MHGLLVLIDWAAPDSHPGNTTTRHLARFGAIRAALLVSSQWTTAESQHVAARYYHDVGPVVEVLAQGR